MNLADIVSNEAVVCDADIGSKKRALELLADLLSDNTDPKQSLVIYQHLTEREKLGSTSLGHGVALPHARTSQCHKATGAFIKLRKGIDFDSPDSQPTDLLFALMVPESYTDEHLEILADLANRFNDENFVDNLRESNTPDELYSHLTHGRITSQVS